MRPVAMRFVLMRRVLAALLTCVPASAFAQSPLPPLTSQQVAAIDSFVAAEMQREHIPGLAVGVYSRGTVLLAKGYGLANVELSVPVKAETIFQSGSVGKQFVSAAVMMLVEEGKVSLDDSITKYFPDAPESWKPILVKNLLSHTSGLSEYESPDRTKAGGLFYLRMDYTEDEMLKKVETLPIENAVGEKWNYRNTNYLLLGILIHRVTGIPYAEFISQRIFRPLGMSSTRLISDADIVPNRAAGYELHGTELKNQAWVSPTFNSTADGAFYFNVLDLAKWDEALYGTRLLKQTSLDRMWTVYPLNDGKPNPDGYGFAWFIAEQNGHKRVGHGGAWQGFTCDISRYPDDSLTVAVLTNLDAAHSQAGLFSHVIAGIVDKPLLPAKLTPIDDTQPETTAALRHILDLMVAGTDVRDLFTPDLARLATPAMVKQIQGRLAKLWPGGELTLVQRRTAQGTTFSLFRLKKNGEAMLIPFELAPDGKVRSLGFGGDREYQ